MTDKTDSLPRLEQAANGLSLPDRGMAQINMVRGKIRFAFPRKAKPPAHKAAR